MFDSGNYIQSVTTLTKFLMHSGCLKQKYVIELQQYIISLANYGKSCVGL